MFIFKLIEANKTIKEQKEIIEKTESNLAKLTIELSNITSNVESQVKDNDKLKSEVVELKSKVREQNEADLLFISTRIVDQIKKGKKKDAPSLLKLQAEQDRLYSLQQQYTVGSYTGQAGINNYTGLGGLGIGGGYSI